MRNLALAAAIMASTPVDAAACHHYSRWYFPWAQRCGATARPGPALAARAASFHLRAAEARPEPSQGLEIPLPFLSLDDCAGGEADEATRARLMLRAALEQPDAH